MAHQPGILAGVPPHAAFVFLDLRHGVAPGTGLAELAAAEHPDALVVGLGPSLLGAASIAGMGPMPALTAPGVAIPSTPTDLFLRIAGADPGEVLHCERAVLASLPSFEVVDRVDGFMYADSRDLSGYVDGTENPEDRATEVALAPDGSSVLAIQRWVHDLDAFYAMPRVRQDHTFGRDRDTNEELDDAPATAHVKRTAQEGFAPEAFVIRRSMPWRDARGAGLVFLAFGATLAPFEAQLRRMTGHDDGQVDALFGFTRPRDGRDVLVSAARGGRLDLQALEG